MSTFNQILGALSGAGHGIEDRAKLQLEQRKAAQQMADDEEQRKLRQMQLFAQGVRPGTTPSNAQDVQLPSANLPVMPAFPSGGLTPYGAPSKTPSGIGQFASPPVPQSNLTQPIAQAIGHPSAAMQVALARAKPIGNTRTFDTGNYTEIPGAHAYVDEQQTPEADAERKTLGTQARQRSALRAAGVPDDKIETGINFPQAIPELFKPSPKDERMRARINALFKDPAWGREYKTPGDRLRAANAQVRLEEGEKPDEPASKQSITLADPKTGEQKVYLFDPKAGTYTEATGVGPKTVGAGGGERAGQAAAFLSRLKMGKADFDNGMQRIRDYHHKLATGAAEITPTMMAEQAAAETNPSTEAHGLLGSLGNAGTALLQGAANEQVGSAHAEYQRYRNLLNSMSLALTEVLPRPSQQLLGIEKGINIAKAGDTPERLADIQGRLDKAYEYMFKNPEALLRRTPSGQASGTGPAVGTAAPTGNIDLRGGDASLSDRDLWEKKRAEGLSPMAATAFVHARRRKQ